MMKLISDFFGSGGSEHVCLPDREQLKSECFRRFIAGKDVQFSSSLFAVGDGSLPISFLHGGAVEAEGLTCFYLRPPDFNGQEFLYFQFHGFLGFWSQTFPFPVSS